MYAPPQRTKLDAINVHVRMGVYEKHTETQGCSSFMETDGGLQHRLWYCEATKRLRLKWIQGVQATSREFREYCNQCH